MLQSGNGPFRMYGSSAYNFQPLGNECPGAYGMLPKRKKKHKCATGRSCSPALFVGLIMCSVLIFVSLMYRTSLVRISEETVALENKISELREQQVRLRIRHAEVFSLEETEQYALSVLGMQRPGADQIKYVYFPKQPDAAVSDNEKKEGDILSRLKEYFPG